MAKSLQLTVAMLTCWCLTGKLFCMVMNFKEIHPIVDIPLKATNVNPIVVQE